MPVTVTVRDGRDGRDSSEVGGQILMVLKRDKPIDVGEFLGLPDGSLRRVAQSRTLGREGSQPVGYGRRPVYKAHSQFKVSLCGGCVARSAGPTRGGGFRLSSVWALASVQLGMSLQVV